MSDKPVHRLYRHFQELPVSMRVLFTGTLLVIGMGYLFGLIYVYASDAGKDGKPGLSVDDIVISYGGSTQGTKLEAALQGPMSSMLSPGDAEIIVDWVKDGATKSAYEAGVAEVFKVNCLDCHDGSNPHLSNLDGFENLQSVVDLDTGKPLHTLVRVSHIHLFGVTFIFFIVGMIFSHAWVRPVWLKSLIMFTPFLCILADVSSWYFTKIYSGFAWVVLFAGGFMGLSFAIMWFTSMYQMWFYKVPTHVRGRHENLID
jgi:mono/diheme cytochrome c family protein